MEIWLWPCLPPELGTTLLSILLELGKNRRMKTKPQTRKGMRKLTKGEVNELYRSSPAIRQLIIKYKPSN